MADLRSNLSNPEAVEESLGLLHGSQAGDDGTNIFLSTLTSGEEAWIGGQQDDVGVWSWSDGRIWNFTSWATGRIDTRY